MISAELSTRSGFATSIIIVVVACLCFSVGEGLRLTPFPVSLGTQVTNDNTAPTVARLRPFATSVSKYGPLAVPTQIQKRGKRQFVNYGNVPEQASHEFSTPQITLADAGEAIHIVSVPFGTLLPGRAPPFRF